jgi:hypothetical protein
MCALRAAACRIHEIAVSRFSAGEADIPNWARATVTGLGDHGNGLVSIFFTFDLFLAKARSPLSDEQGETPRCRMNHHSS